MAKSSSVRSNSRKARRHNPLSEDITSVGLLRPNSKKRKGSPENEEDRYVDSRSTRKILKIGQDLVDEEQEQDRKSAPNPAFALESRLGEESEQDEDVQFNSGEEWGDEDEDEVEEAVRIQSIIALHPFFRAKCIGLQEIDPTDLDMFNKFVPADQNPLIQSVNHVDEEGDQGTNLADLILEKIAAHEAAQAGEPVIQGGGPPEDAIELPAKVVEVYSKYVGQYEKIFISPRVATENCLELAYYYLATNPANSPNLLRSSPPYRNGRSFFPSQDQSHGPRMRAMKQPRSLFPRSPISRNGSWSGLYLIGCVRISMRRKS